MAQELYFKPAAAFVRGQCQISSDFDLPTLLREKPLYTLSRGELRQICDLGQRAGLRLHRYKRSTILPRVQRVLGILKGLQPSSLLDIGSGRGAFLWPLIDTLPYVAVTAIDANEHRATQLQTVALGGLEQLSAHKMDATALVFANDQFDIVTALEVLEHIPLVQQAIAEIVRAARCFIIVSVPSKEDNNPEHIHRFTQLEVRQLFAQAGIIRVNVEYVHNHMIVIANISHAKP